MPVEILSFCLSNYVDVFAGMLNDINASARQLRYTTIEFLNYFCV